MKKIYVLMIAAAAALFCVSCDNASGPEKVAKKAVSAIQKGDYVAYAATFDLSADDQKQLAGLVEEKVGKKIEGKGGIKSYSIGESEIGEDKAKVTVHIIYNDGSEEDENMNFVLVDNEWKQKIVK